jgi:preprotein translocase subunit SecE
MAIQEDVKREGAEEEAPADPEAAEAAEAAEGSSGASVQDAPRDLAQTEGGESFDVAPVGVSSPSQLGTRRFVYAAYFAGAIGIAFIMSKLLDFAWYRLQTWKPGFGEPRPEIIMLVSALIGTLAAVYYWYRTRARELAEQVASEMSKVTWPSRTEVTNGTFVVIVTTVISTVFFALMDRFWGFLTNLVYGGS